MKNITLVGLDIAKNVFQFHGVDKTGKAVMKKKIHRGQLLEKIANLTACTIAMEACGGAHYWARQFRKLGHEVKLISPHFVKPYVKTNKNDAHDAQAIAEAASRPDMRFVPIKQVEHQDIQSIHRIRSRLVKQRTALGNQIRGLLAEYGEVLPKGHSYIRKRLPEILGQEQSELTYLTVELCADLYEEYVSLEERIEKYDQKLNKIFKENPLCQRFGKVEGVGAITATILLTVLSEPGEFKNGRHFAAYLGLVPKQHSSGGKTRLLGISKRGDSYMRSVLVHGARAAVKYCTKKEDKRSRWVKEVKARRGYNKASVALANKNARTLWALAAREESYQCAA